MLRLGEHAPIQFRDALLRLQVKLGRQSSVLCCSQRLLRGFGEKVSSAFMKLMDVFVSLLIQPRPPFQPFRKPRAALFIIPLRKNFSTRRRASRKAKHCVDFPRLGEAPSTECLSALHAVQFSSFSQNASRRREQFIILCAEALGARAAATATND
jgi:hypothetical protein